MARSLVINSRFNPFSYSEMVAPVQLAQQEHNLVEEGLGELSTRAGIWDKLANEQTDPKAYAQYKAYADDLTKQVDLLSREGLTPGTRRGLIDMKRRYSAEITPIEIAASKREQLTKEQREAMQRDPSLMFDRDYSATSLDDLINDPNATYSSISGTELTKRSAQMAANLAKTIQSNPEYQAVLGGQYFQQMQQMGYTPQQIMQTIMDDPNAPAELKQIADTVYEEAGLSNWDRQTQSRAREYINSGLYEAIGTQRYDNQGNKGYISPMDAQRLELEKERLSMMKEQQEWTRDEKKGYLMSDGTRVKPLGGGRVMITKPDGSFGGIQAAPSTRTSTKPAKSELFIALNYTNGNNFSKPGSTDYFSESDAKKISFSDLGLKARKKLVEDLAKYELTPEDVDIYEDYDYASNSHYRIVKKGANVKGELPATQEQSQKQSTVSTKNSLMAD